MSLYLDDGDVRLYHGDALEQLSAMPSESVQCIVTSPPFWGLRDYGTGSWVGGDEACDHKHETKHQQQGATSQRAGRSNAEDQRSENFRDVCGKCGATRVDQQIGLEETPDEWCARLVAVMREARRVLRSDGVCWIEVGDTYAGGGGYSPGSPSNVARQEARANGVGFDGAFAVRDESHYEARKSNRTLGGVKPKDLVGAPWLLAFALRADGWYLRSDTIWARPNPMPESVTDRPTKAHSYVFLLTKSSRYYFDADSIREAHETADRPGARRSYTSGSASSHRMDGGHEAMTGSFAGLPLNPAGRNARSVWTISTEPTPFAHFATFPQALVERCIKAGTSEHGACSECGAPWRRMVDRGENIHPGDSGRNDVQGDAQRGKRADGIAIGTVLRERSAARTNVTTGWEPSCDHDAPVAPCLVADPFMGSGTTALVARRLGRHAIGIELNGEYLGIAAKRLEQLSLLA